MHCCIIFLWAHFTGIVSFSYIWIIYIYSRVGRVVIPRDTIYVLEIAGIWIYWGAILGNIFYGYII